MLRQGLGVLFLAALLLLGAVAVLYAALAGPAARVLGQPAAQAPAVPEVLRAQRLELVTAEGKVWADMGIGSDGSRGLLLYDEQGRKRVELVLREGRSGLLIHDPAMPHPAGDLVPTQPKAAPSQPSGSEPPHAGLAPSGGS